MTQFTFLKDFDKRMKSVGRYVVLFSNSSQKSTWKNYGVDSLDEQVNMIFTVLLYIMEASLKEEDCTIDDIAGFLNETDYLYYKRNIHDKSVEMADFIVIENMSEKELNTYCTGLKREWKKNDSYREKCRIKVADLIRDTASVEEYKDEFFRKGFDNLLSQTDNAYSLKKQHDIIIGSYRGILEKLEVDLANIDKERKNVEEVFLEYNRDVNEDLGKIDKNSTIKVRGRDLKMLKIKVPDWETVKERYKVKLHDYIDIVVRYGIDAIENNRNVEDVIGKLVTTKKMYDEIVGIENIGIRMYKIEEEREVPISWADVSANSGGEGFLSAFVILVCLLSYMRRDDADIFSRGEEGKVLIMDNPFAQTNAAHLLKPLMEMAERTNTQLICLSGLGGDSIYNRFDNIYVLKLINMF